MNQLLKLLLLESSTSMADHYSVFYDNLSERVVKDLREKFDMLEQAVASNSIYNVEFNEIKDTISRALEKALRANVEAISRDNTDDSPHILVYQADVNTYVYLNQCKSQIEKIKKCLRDNKFNDKDKALLEKALEINEAGKEINDILTKLKPHIIKGRRKAEPDPNKFYNKLGSEDSIKLVNEKLKDGIKEPLDFYEKSLRRWIQSIIDSIKDPYVIKSGPQTIDGFYFHRYFDSKKDYENSDREKTTYKDVKLDPKYSNIAEKEAKSTRDGIELRYLTKNIKKLSNIIDLKGNLTSIEALPYRKPEIAGSSGVVESGFKFKFDDGSEFTVVNKIVTKYSFTGKPFEQFPTTFHDVKFPDGSKMKHPSEEKMVKEFGKWKKDEAV